MSPSAFLTVATLLFGLGLYGVIARRSPLIMLMCVELMLNAANLAFVSLAVAMNDAVGLTAVFFVLVVAAAEAVVGLGIAVAIIRRQPGASADDLKELAG